MFKKIKDVLTRDNDERVRLYLKELINHTTYTRERQQLTFDIIEYLKFNGARECTIEVYQVPIKRVYQVDLKDVNYDSKSKFCEIKTRNSETFYISNDFSHNNSDSRYCKIYENKIQLNILSSNFKIDFIITLPYPIKDVLNRKSTEN